MKIVIDSNILFSALLKSDAKLAEIILNPSFDLDKYTCYFLYVEIFKYKEKILRLSKLSEDDLLEVLYRLIRKIVFVNESTTPDAIWEQAKQLTAGIDTKDTAFVALAVYPEATLWTGDRKLLEGLQARGFTQVIDTATLLHQLNVS